MLHISNRAFYSKKVYKPNFNIYNHNDDTDLELKVVTRVRIQKSARNQLII